MKRSKDIVYGLIDIESQESLMIHYETRAEAENAQEALKAMDLNTHLYVVTRQNMPKGSVIFDT